MLLPDTPATRSDTTPLKAAMRAEGACRLAAPRHCTPADIRELIMVAAMVAGLVGTWLIEIVIFDKI